MKELGKLCRIYCSRNHQSWSLFLGDFQNILNELPHGATGLSPVEVLKNQTPGDRVREIVDFPPGVRQRHSDIVKQAIKHIQKEADSRVRRQKGKLRILELRVGDKVLVRAHRLSKKHQFKTHKFYNIFCGPFRVRRVIHSNAVELETLKGRKSRGVHHVSNLKKWLE